MSAATIPGYPDDGAPQAQSAELSPDMRQFVSRLMAGYEAAHRRIVDIHDATLARLDRAESAAARAVDTQLKMAEEYERLVSLRHERELATQLTARKVEAFGSIAKDLRSLAPIALKRWLGIPLSGNDTHGMQNLLASLDEQQIEALMSRGELRLTEGQRMALAMVIGSIAEAEEPAAALAEKGESDGDA